MEIREVHAANDGRDPFPVLVCRQRLPKNRANVECRYPEQLHCEFYFTPSVCILAVAGVCAVPENIHKAPRKVPGILNHGKEVSKAKGFKIKESVRVIGISRGEFGIQIKQLSVG